MNVNSVYDIRSEFVRLYKQNEFVTDKSGVKTVEIINASFVADVDTIFGEVNRAYVARELAWYNSLSLNVNDIPEGPPAIWKQVADEDGFINSNYGWCVYSEENNYQYYHVLSELEDRPDSRRAIIIYTRPTMWGEHNKNGRSDFMCTNTVQYVIRNGALHAIVNMRSNDAWAGYRNDYAWQLYMLNEIIYGLILRGKPYKVGKIFWNVGSLHIYERQFYLIDHYYKTGSISITKDEYEKLYGSMGTAVSKSS